MQSVNCCVYNFKIIIFANDYMITLRTSNHWL